MTHLPDAPLDHGSTPAWDVPKERLCLRCRSPFNSEWSGQRICPYCKKSSVWRNGY